MFPNALKYSDKDGAEPEKEKSKESDPKPDTPEDNSPHGQQVRFFFIFQY